MQNSYEVWYVKYIESLCSIHYVAVINYIILGASILYEPSFNKLTVSLKL